MTKLALGILILIAVFWVVLFQFRADAGDRQQTGVFACERCGTLFTQNSDSRRCPDDGGMLLYTGYAKWSDYIKSKESV